ncbi:hypothetical protein Csa_001835 [Cucumis sativus]|uniref:Uncharacterized protein n=1 Tax=Cucumis sativus TaxID=3659 RepID=A0A0A0LFP6_CUCSA|nr:hypothetical protein Csa_001835 [Cucumis sativus]
MSIEQSFRHALAFSRSVFSSSSTSKELLQFRSPIKASAVRVAFRRRRRIFLAHKLPYFFIVLLEFRESSVCSAKEGVYSIRANK